MDALDKHVRNHYEAVALDTNQIHRILTSGFRHSTLFCPISGAITAGILALASMAIHHHTSIGERADRTRREAVMNHSTRPDLEFMPDKIDTSNQKMALLPFYHQFA